MLGNIKYLPVMLRTQRYVKFRKTFETIRRYTTPEQSGGTKEQPESNIKVCRRERSSETYLQYISSLDVQSKVIYTKKAGIICTIGPASREVETLIAMMDAGMGIARLNFSHGSHEYHKGTMVNVREAVEIRSKRLGIASPIAIALDTKGPEIRTGIMAEGIRAEKHLKKGSVLQIHVDEKFKDKVTATDIFIDYPKLTKVLKVGSDIYIDDGQIHLKVQAIEKDSLKCTVVTGGTLGSKKGVNLPGVQTNLPSLSKKDVDDIQFAIDNDIDIIFASFIRRKEDVEAIRKLIVGKGESIKVVAKIENHQGIENVDDIIEVSDGIMVARGDLGIEIPTERIFLAQKQMIASCNMVGKPVICATQMLESMTLKPRPTRAESSDVANAILDGADCVMLSGETAKGEYPVECVTVMADICRTTEAAFQHLKFFQDMSRLVPAPTDTTQSIAIAAVAAANKVLATAILVITATGYSAFVLSKFRPPCNIFAVTNYPSVARKCFLYRGIIPVLHTRKKIDDWALYTEDKIRTGLRTGLSRNHIKEGDRVIVMTGWKKGKGNTSTMRIVHVTATIVEEILKT